MDKLKAVEKMQEYLGKTIQEYINAVCLTAGAEELLRAKKAVVDMAPKLRASSLIEELGYRAHPTTSNLTHSQPLLARTKSCHFRMACNRP